MTDETQDERKVALLGRQPPRHISAPRVYFAFESGRWAYDCARCGAHCCKGFDYSIRSQEELRVHLCRSPLIRLFLNPPARTPLPNLLTVRNFRPGCVMLTKDGRCGIELAAGYDSKPETCRLFPFNLLKCVGDHLVVAPHMTLCALQLSDTEVAASSHASLLADLEAQGVMLNVLDATCVEPDPARAIAVERAVLSLCRQFGEGGRYEDFVLAQISAAVNGQGHSEEGSGRAPLRTGAHLEEYCSQLRAVLGAWPAAAHDESPNVVRMMVAITPAVRAQFVFPKRQPPFGEAPWCPLSRVPYVLLALQKVVALLCEAGMAQPSYQTVMGVVEAYRSFLTLACRLDCSLTWAPTAKIPLLPMNGAGALADEVYFVAAKALLRTARARPLGQMLGEACRAADVGRLALLEDLSRVLTGRLVLRTGREQRSCLPRAPLRRWVMAKAPVDLLCALATRRRRTDHR